MHHRLRPRSVYDVLAVVGCFAALTTGGAYAANTIGSADIIDQSILSQDVKNGEVKGADLAPSAVTSTKINDGSVIASEIGTGAVVGGPGGDVKDGTVGAPDLAAGSVTREKRAAPEAWRYVGEEGQPAFTGGWTHYDDAESPAGATWGFPAFRRDDDGTVHLAGLVKGGVLGERMFSLPSGYCPYFFRTFPVISNNALGRVTITGDFGDGCTVTAQVGDPSWVSLDGISYQEASLDAR